MKVAQKVQVTKYYRDEKRKILTKIMPGVIVSGVKYTKDGVIWHWCVTE